MPICPHCNSQIHTGAEDQCPVCGYSLERANRIFGRGDVEFTRVLDEAGALTHPDRQELLRTLEDLERNIPPVALCIYITAHGQAQEFRTLAHWVLNHAHIHHPSFGKREKMRAIEDAAFAERIPGEAPEGGKRPQQMPESWWSRFRKGLRDVLHPYPPPVRQEWMLMLVLDVQLEIACFSWGYMLDPYINPDSINSCIIGARLQFRERAMAVGLKKVMRAAVSKIAAQSYRVNRKLRRSPQALGLMAGGICALAPMLWAEPSAAGLADSPWADDEQAEEAEEDIEPMVGATAAPVVEVAPAAKPAKEEAATYDVPPPRWDDADYRHLLSGELGGCYRMLASPARSVPRSTTGSESGSQQRSRQQIESDTKILKQYYRGYAEADPSGLIDPQRLFPSVERADVEHTLRELNAGVPYRLFAAVHRQGQEMPLELSAGALARTVAMPGEYTVVLMYGTGDSPQIELGTHELSLSDESRHACLERVRQAAMRAGGRVEGLMAALYELRACLAPLVEDLPPLTEKSVVNVPLIPLEMRPEEEHEGVSFKDELREVLEAPGMRPFLLSIGSVLAVLALGALFFLLRRRSGKLLKSPADVRLGSPYGAGVSRNVRYLEGREMRKPPRSI